MVEIKIIQGDCLERLKCKLCGRILNRNLNKSGYCSNHRYLGEKFKGYRRNYKRKLDKARKLKIENYCH